MLVGKRARLGRSEPRPRGSHGARETDPPFGDCHAASVRREAHRTAAEVAALPKEINCIVPLWPFRLKWPFMFSPPLTPG